MTEFKTKIYASFDSLTKLETEEVASFLHTHLQEYRDPKKDIKKAIAYAIKESSSPGGFVLTCSAEGEIVGTVVVNKTGMEGYIPENILVYIAVHSDFRGKGIGKKLMTQALNICDGDIALHVEPDNPAKLLYEKLGFENNYLEMRFKKNKDSSKASLN